MSRVGTVERAYQIARSGECATVRQIRLKLVQEGYFDAAGQIMTPLLIRELGRYCRAAHGRPADADADGAAQSA